MWQKTWQMKTGPSRSHEAESKRQGGPGIRMCPQGRPPPPPVSPTSSNAVISVHDSITGLIRAFGQRPSVPPKPRLFLDTVLDTNP